MLLNLIIDFFLLTMAFILMVMYYRENKIGHLSLFIFFFYVLSLFIVKNFLTDNFITFLLGDTIEPVVIKHYISFFWYRLFIVIFFLFMLKYVFDLEIIKKRILNNFLFLY